MNKISQWRTNLAVIKGTALKTVHSLKNQLRIWISTMTGSLPTYYKNTKYLFYCILYYKIPLLLYTLLQNTSFTVYFTTKYLFHCILYYKIPLSLYTLLQNTSFTVYFTTKFLSNHLQPSSTSILPTSFRLLKVI
jgi:hypothetical protein